MGYPRKGLINCGLSKKGLINCGLSKKRFNKLWAIQERFNKLWAIQERFNKLWAIQERFNKRYYGPPGNLGPVVQSIISLTSSLRVISLTVLADSIYNILIFFAEKM